MFQTNYRVPFQTATLNRDNNVLFCSLCLSLGLVSISASIGRSHIQYYIFSLFFKFVLSTGRVAGPSSSCCLSLANGEAGSKCRNETSTKTLITLQIIRPHTHSEAKCVCVRNRRRVRQQTAVRRQHQSMPPLSTARLIGSPPGTDRPIVQSDVDVPHVGRCTGEVHLLLHALGFRGDSLLLSLAEAGL